MYFKIVKGGRIELEVDLPEGTEVLVRIEEFAHQCQELEQRGNLRYRCHLTHGHHGQHGFDITHEDELHDTVINEKPEMPEGFDRDLV